ncbi:hypothetical protein PAUR_a2918 [Pseudoalteromonas aurantia 208]|uniref:Orphan protein n=1 Tax=Pseudoalteromonas aurantia 208 TaxID=1314867 RepID=A0ABR9EDV2_9GAMM|nr:hypothetical protein [Pseudoalteromonas aurantia 208]
MLSQLLYFELAFFCVDIGLMMHRTVQNPIAQQSTTSYTMADTSALN